MSTIGTPLAYHLICSYIFQPAALFNNILLHQLEKKTMKKSSAIINSVLILVLGLLHSTFQIRHAVDSLLLPIPPSPKVLCKAVACKIRKKNKMIFRKKKRTNPLIAAGAAAAATATVVGAGAVILNNVEASEIYTPEANSLKGQSILITGGTTGLGLETAKRLAIGGPDNLVITARTPAKGQAAVDSINDYLSSSEKDVDSVSVSYRILDLDDVQGIQDAVERWFEDENSPFPDQLDCIVNNAGVMNIPKLELTVDGIERQMASNHLGHFVLTKLLVPKLSNRAKVISVSSTAHEFAKPDGMDFDYCWKGSPNYNSWKSYGQSKLANILFSQELQRRSDEAGYDWDVACLHPGVVNTDLWRQSLGPENFERFQEFQTNIRDTIPAFVTDGLDTLSTKIGDLGLFKTVEQGATTSVWLASGGYQNENDTERTKAKYYDDRKAKSLDSFATSVVAAERLWKESEERAGITFDLMSPIEKDTNSETVDDAAEDDDEIVDVDVQDADETESGESEDDADADATDE